MSESSIEHRAPEPPFTTLSVEQAPENRGGRPPKRPEDRFTARIEIRCRQVDKEALMRKAEETREPLSTYLVRKGLGRPAPRVKVEP